jgi:hypothetical protein
VSCAVEIECGRGDVSSIYNHDAIRYKLVDMKKYYRYSLGHGLQVNKPRGVVCAKTRQRCRRVTNGAAGLVENGIGIVGCSRVQAWIDAITRRMMYRGMKQASSRR